MRSFGEAAVRFISAWFVMAFLPILLICVSLVNRRYLRPLGNVCYQALHRIIGVRSFLCGVPDSRTCLFVANHSSYMDILVLGGLLNAGFISKGEVGRWPIVGYVAALMDTFFVSRRRDTLIQELRGLMRNMASGKKYILFPEGTSNDGTYLLPFKTSLFQMLRSLEGGAWVQPVALELVGLNGLPMRRCFQKLYSWRGRQGLLGHLWLLCRLGVFDVRVKMGPARYVGQGDCRQKLAESLRETIAGMLDPRPPVQDVRQTSAPA